MPSPAATRHSPATRLFHGTLALAILVQLGSSQFMQVPRGVRLGNAAFEVHQWSGMVALGLALVLWAVVITRSVGTDAGALLPWFSSMRRAVLRDDITRHWAAARKLTFPQHRDDSAFASAVHGLGLLLITAMAATGTIYVIAGQIGYQDHPVVHTMMDLHGLGANLVWAYLIGHAGLATIHHLRGDQSLGTMWSPRITPTKGV